VDPQTSGGLLISVAEDAIAAVEAALRAASTAYKIIGETVDPASLPAGKLFAIE
jgi:selenophosphate synthase